jgi:hypothetical protein
VPTEHPRLDHLVYEVILADLVHHDAALLAATLAAWPAGAYDVPVVLIAVQSELDRLAVAPPSPSSGATKALLRGALADLFLANRQPGRALPLFLQLRRPGVFALVREHGLFKDVQDQARALVAFDHELMAARKERGEDVDVEKGEAIALLVEHIHSIPVGPAH